MRQVKVSRNTKGPHQPDAPLLDTAWSVAAMPGSEPDLDRTDGSQAVESERTLSGEPRAYAYSAKRESSLPI
jgi:hypothetical protein